MLESTHPCADGNGRIGQAIAEKSLAQALGRPTLTPLAATILVRRKTYAAPLQAASREMEVTAWLRWFAGITIEAQLRTAAGVGFLLDKTRVRGQLTRAPPETGGSAVGHSSEERPEV